MRGSQRFHYFTSDEVRLLRRLEDDIRAVIKANKPDEAPHQRLQEWAVHLSILNNQRRPHNEER